MRPTCIHRNFLDAKDELPQVGGGDEKGLGDAGGRGDFRKKMAKPGGWLGEETFKTLVLFPKQFTVGFSLRRKKVWQRYALAASPELVRHCPPCVRHSPPCVRRLSALCPP